jgi:hypothetical protein
MNAVLKEPKRLTRASLIGNSLRLAKLYGPTVIGARIGIAYDRAMGCRDSIFERVLARALLRGLCGFDNVHGEKVRVRKFTAAEREDREIQARIERGERFALSSRQAG